MKTAMLLEYGLLTLKTVQIFMEGFFYENNKIIRILLKEERENQRMFWKEGKILSYRLEILKWCMESFYCQ